MRTLVATLGMAALTSVQAAASEVETSAGPMQITAMAEGLEEPWGLAFLPDGGFLVTERDGRLRRYPGGDSLTGLPEVFAKGQGGLLDVLVPRDFTSSGTVFLTYAMPVAGGAVTAVGKGQLTDDGLTGFAPIWQAPDPMRGGRHFGARLVEAADGTLYLATGERGTGPDGLQAQDPQRGEGKVIALLRDGEPAITQNGWLPGVISLGHRNPQGAALDGEGRLWLVEHGAQGGDELNRITPGANYGWPVIAFGENYGGGQIGEGTEKTGMAQPVTYWDPSIAPSGLMIHSGAGVAEWSGDFFTGSLKFDYLSRLDPEAGFAEERISAPETGRVRDVRQAPDGSIWFLSVSNGAVYRMAPRP